MVFWVSFFLLASASDIEIQDSFLKFVSDFRPEGYADDQEALNRYSIFKDNYNLIKEMNESQNEVTLAINQFADLTQEEFAAQYLHPITSKTEMPIRESFEGLPDSVDWAALGAVSPTVNSCQMSNFDIISTVVKTVETLHFVQTGGKLEALSYQQLIDCATSAKNVEDYYRYIAFAGGLMSEADYPSGTQGDCKFDRTKVKAQVNSYEGVAPQNQRALQIYNSLGTVAVAVDASSSVWQFYSSGIISANCGKTLDHEVLLVGYGTSDGTEFWKIQNSWGASWGLEGYALLLRNGSTQAWGECGIAIQPYIPTYEHAHAN